MNLYEVLPAEDAAILAPMLGFYGILLLLVCFSWLINYLFRGFGMYTLAKKQNTASPWMAWVPYVRTYLNGQLAGEIKLGKKTMRHTGLWFLFLPMACPLLFFIVLIIYFVSIVFTSISLVNLPEAQIISAVFTMLFAWVAIIMVLSVAISVVTAWITILVHHNIYKKYRSENVALTHAILSAFVPLYGSIYLFILSRRAEAVPSQPYFPPILPDQE